MLTFTSFVLFYGISTSKGHLMPAKCFYSSINIWSHSYIKGVPCDIMANVVDSDIVQSMFKLHCVQ